MGMQPGDHNPVWPLPNMKPATERDFWAMRSQYSPKGEAWLGYQQPRPGIIEERGTAMVFYHGNGGMIDAGFAVLYDHSYGNEKVHYYKWSLCEHDWHEKTIGRCLHKVTCSKCGKSYEYDSGD